MALHVPVDFDVQAQKLDVNEIIVRDHLKLDITNWAKFRYVIKIGNDSTNLRPLGGAIPPSVKDSYRELAKSHYEVVTSLGCVRLSYELAAHFSQTNPLQLKKSVKDFYFHIGCVLDNLARIIYILNDPNSATATTKAHRLVRHWIDWGGLPNYAGYVRIRRSKTLREMVNIRNAFTHSWSCPFGVAPNGVLLWPKAIRTKRDYYWPQDEPQIIRKKYRRWFPVLSGLKNDLEFIERFQSRVFAKLIKDVEKFERHYNLVIQ